MRAGETQGASAATTWSERRRETERHSRARKSEQLGGSSLARDVAWLGRSGGRRGRSGVGPARSEHQPEAARPGDLPERQVHGRDAGRILSAPSADASIGCYCVAPLGLIVTTLTSHGKSKKTDEAKQQQRLTIIGILQDRVRSEGILGLWRGEWINALTNFMTKFCFFFCYSVLTQVLSVLPVRGPRTTAHWLTG